MLGIAWELPEEDSGAKVDFLFVLASNAALSGLDCRGRFGKCWSQQHFEHLCADSGFEDLERRAVLRFGERPNTWNGSAGAQRPILHYGVLSEHAQAWSDFAGVPFHLSPGPRRGPLVADVETRARFAATYAARYAQIAAIPACQVLQ